MSAKKPVKRSAKKSTARVATNKDVTDTVLRAVYRSAKKIGYNAFLTGAKTPSLVHHYVLARLEIDRSNYHNALMHYSMGLPDIALVPERTLKESSVKQGLYRAYNIDIRTVLEGLLYDAYVR